METNNTKGGTMRLWRAADSDAIDHTASFSDYRPHAEAYLSNPGYGGSRLWALDIEPQNVLDLVDCDDPMAALLDALGLDELPQWVLVAETADCAVPQLQSELEDAGYEWVRVRDTYPDDCITWIWVGGDVPELTAVE